MAVLALLVVAAGALLVTGGATAVTEPATPRTVVVGERETVWDLVAPYVPEGVDRAVYAAEVVAANGVDPLRVPPGTVLRLP